MASDDRWDDAQRANEGAFGDQPAAPKRGMSTTVKVLLIIFGVGGVLVLLCCGGAALFFYKNVALQTNPTDIRATLAEIADMDVPASFQPQQGMKMNMGFSMKMVMFQAGQGGNLAIVEMAVPGGANEAQMRQQMQQQNFGQNQNITIGETETREFDIKGQKSAFQFAKATNQQGSQIRQVSGTFPGKGGTAMLVLQVPESSYKEDEVVKMIESIH